MRILILASPDSIYTMNYIDKVLYGDFHEIILPQSSNDDINERYRTKYNITLVDLKKAGGIISKIPKVRTLYSNWVNLKKISKKNTVDIVHIHYLGDSLLYFFLARLIRKISSRLIITFWGSDLFHDDTKKTILNKRILKKADIISLGTEEMLKKFKQSYGYKYDDKIKFTRFGNDYYGKYEEILANSEKENFRKANAIADEKFVVAIGYNGSRVHQHLEVIGQMDRLNKEYKEKIVCLVQLSYGLDSTEYYEEIENALKNANLDYRIITKFLDIEELVCMKEEVNIFIHAQTTDALSASILEYIYARTFVLNPIWIKYKEWETVEGIDYVEYGSFSELPLLISNLIKSKQMKNSTVSQIKIKNEYSWEARKKEWLDLYKPN